MTLMFVCFLFVCLFFFSSFPVAALDFCQSYNHVSAEKQRLLNCKECKTFRNFSENFRCNLLLNSLRGTVSLTKNNHVLYSILKLSTLL